MKKMIELTTLAVLAVAITGVISHFQVGKEVKTIVKDAVHKILPWVNQPVYS
jgi:Na+/H+ antiporter NhaC